MFKQVFAVFLNSFAEAQKLEQRYQRLTSRLGWVTVATGCLGLIWIMYKMWLFFGLPLEGGSIEGLRSKLVSWVFLTCLMVPIAFYTGMILVYGAFGAVMFAVGRFTWHEAVGFACQAKYPDRWYRRRVEPIAQSADDRAAR